MPSTYLTTDEVASYGAPAGTTLAQITAASALVDTYLKRSEGLVWAPDASGLPAYMVGMTAILSPKTGAAISPGLNVVVPLALGWLTTDMAGEVLILDRTGTCEAVVVVASDTQAGTVTLARVLYPHVAGIVAEMGLVITEERPLTAQRSVTRVSRPQLARLISGAGRYSYGRRSDQQFGQSDLSLLASAAILGGVPTWQSFEVAAASVSITTGEVWVPAGLLMAHYSDVRVRYVAGFPATAIPAAVKQATANLVNNALAGADAGPQFKIIQAGGTRQERFDASNFDPDTKALLEPYRTRVMA